MSEAEKPILAVDVDGVVSLFDYDEPPEATVARFELIDGSVHCISIAAGERLRRLSESFDLIWATGWEERANQHISPLLGLPELPYLAFEGSARFGSAHWKVPPLDGFTHDKAVAWIDDSFDEPCYRWARGRSEPTLLVPTESPIGLEEAQTEALLAWARSLATPTP